MKRLILLFLLSLVFSGDRSRPRAETSLSAALDGSLSAENRIIFRPTVGRPEAPPAGVQELFFDAEDGVRLNAWYRPAPDGAATVLYLHGQGGNLAETAATQQWMQRAGLGVFLVDYRGYGLSQGSPSEEGVYRDARAAYAELLKRGVPPQRILIHGQSLGGAIAVHLAAERACAGLILESTFTNARAMAQRMFGRAAALAVRSRFASDESIKAVHCPVLVIHGRSDDYIPDAMGRALYEAANQPKELWLVNDAGHGNLRYKAGEDYSRRLREFAHRCCP